MKIVKLLGLIVTLSALLCAQMHPFSEYGEQESTIEQLEIDFRVSYFAGHDARHYTIKKENGAYIDDSGKIIDTILMENVAASLTDLYAAEELEMRTVMTDYYPSFHILLTHSGGEILITSKSNDYCNIPWNIEMNGQIFVQFNGKIPTALFALLIEIDEDYWSFMDKEARFDCLSAPIPLEYAQKGPSPFIAQTSPDILPEEEMGTSHLQWTIDVEDYLIHTPLIQNGTVYCATRDHIFCIDISSGLEKWSVFPEMKIHGLWYCIEDSIQYLDDRLYVTLERGILCLDSQTGEIVWEIMGNRLRRFPLFQDDNLYIVFQLPKDEYSGDPDRLLLMCVDAQTGEIFWEHTFLKPGTGFLTEETHLDGGQVYINSCEPALHCLDIQTGDIIWDFTGHEISEIHVFKTNLILINFTQGIITCLDKKTGAVKWEKCDFSRIYDVRIMTDDTILIPISTPSDITDILLHVETGEILWEGQIYGYGQKDITDENILYFPTLAVKTVCALQISTGKELWKYDFENEINTVYVTEEGILVADTIPEEKPWSHNISSLYFLDIEGTVEWKYHYGPQRSPYGIHAYVHDSILFVTTREGIIDALDYNTGTLLWSTELQGRTIFEVLFHDNRIYCSCDDGRIYCLSEETGDIRWIVNTHSGFALRSSIEFLFLSIYMELHGKLLIVGIENGFLCAIVLE